MGRAVVDFLNDLEALCAEQDLERASGLLLEVDSNGYRQIVGPFPKDTAAIYAAIERLRSEEDPEQVIPNEYSVALLYPVSSTQVPHPEYPAGPDSALDRCVCGGVRHWHAPAPLGCDDCLNCEEFRLAE